MMQQKKKETSMASVMMQRLLLIIILINHFNTGDVRIQPPACGAFSKISERLPHHEFSAASAAKVMRLTALSLRALTTGQHDLLSAVQKKNPGEFSLPGS